MVVPAGSFATAGKSVAPSAVSSSRLRVLENVLEMELERDEGAAQPRYQRCETPDPHTLA